MKLDSKHRSHTLLLTEVCFLGGFRHGTGQSPCAEDFPLKHTSTGPTGPYICSFQDVVAFLQHGVRLFSARCGGTICLVAPGSDVFLQV